MDSQAQETQNQLLSTQIKLYRDFVKELVKVNTVLDKKFYIIIPYSYLEKGVMVSSDSFLNQAKTSLASKAESVLSQIARLNLRAKILQKEELIKFFYEIYNGDAVEINQITDEIKTPIVRSSVSL